MDASLSHFDAAETTPYLHITAPEKACGKSRLMEALEALSAAPIRSGGMTAAALVRTIEAKKPTIFLDEMDAQLGGDKEFAEAIRGILNEGFRKGGIFYKCVGKDFDLKGFRVYCPKCFAGIDSCPTRCPAAPLLSRCAGSYRGSRRTFPAASSTGRRRSHPSGIGAMGRRCCSAAPRA